jgi:hypothetical protein
MRITIAISDSGTLVHGIWDWDSRRVDQVIRDRIANNESFPGEHAVRLPRRFSRRKDMTSARALTTLYGNPWVTRT